MTELHQHPTQLYILCFSYVRYEADDSQFLLLGLGESS